MITPVPSEFAGFVRQAGVRAFDRLAVRAKELDAPLRNFVRSWSRLSEKDKLELFDQLIAVARESDQEEIAPPPATKQKRAVKRYDPEEVAATLPRKKVKAKPTRKRN